MHFAILVVRHRVLLESLGDQLVINHDFAFGLCIAHEFQNIEQFARIAARVTE